jgi:predicted HNH restriction endonuclease
MKKYIVKVKSTTPLLLNTRQRELDEEKKELKKDQLTEWEEKNWRKKAERDKKGNVYLPPRWFRSSFVQACKSSGMVPSFATSKRQTYSKYAQSMIFQNTSFVCNEKELKEHGAFVTPRGQGQIWTIRPKIENWETDIEIIDPFGRMTEKEFKELLEYSGMLVGVGDGRSLNFGRFEIVSIKEKK